MQSSRPNSRGESGQAMVEAALTLPLAVFLILGTLQLFLMLHARIITEFAAFRAARAGSVAQGKCERMRHAAILALLPTFTRTTTPAELAREFGRREDNRFRPGRDSGHRRTIVWIDRESPTLRDIAAAANRAVANVDDAAFDDPDRPVQRLDIRLIYWYPLRIPFANWVMSHMFLAHFAIQRWRYGDATMLFKKNAADWNVDTRPALLRGDVEREMRLRVNARQYAFPIHASYSMRMMTPARREYFDGRNPWCL